MEQEAQDCGRQATFVGHRPAQQTARDALHDADLQPVENEGEYQVERSCQQPTPEDGTAGWVERGRRCLHCLGVVQ